MRAALLVTAAVALASTAARAAEPAKAPAEAPVEAAPEKKTDRYVHRWIPMPAVGGARLGRGDPQAQARVAPRKGRAAVVVFLASWCEPCQQLTPELLKLVQRYQRLDVDVHYVFAHDTKDDAEGFMKEFGITEGVLANFDVLKAYHNPELPTVYVGDRYGWLTTRYPKTGSRELGQLDELLRHLTAL